jgi:hypothetical protein
MALPNEEKAGSNRKGFLGFGWSEVEIDVNHILILLLITFVFLSSMYYKGFAYVFITPRYYTGFDIPHLDGNIAVVTGLGTALSQVTALELARRGAHVFSTAPSLEVKNNVEHRLAGSRAQVHGKLDIFVTDMSSLREVSNFCNRVKLALKGQYVDYIILNVSYFVANNSFKFYHRFT